MSSSPGPSSSPGGRAVQILIVHHQGPELLQACCRSLLEAPSPPHRVTPYRVAVVESGSQDGAAEALRSRWPLLEVLRTPNAGYAAAVNAGMRAYPAEFHLILNSDTEVSPAAVAELHRFLLEHPRCGAASPAEADAQGRPQLAWGRFPTLLREVRRGWLQARVDRGLPLPRSVGDGDSPRPRRVDWISGSSMFVRAAAVAEARDMDDGYFLYFEDVDWCRALARAGWEVWYCPQARILHHRGRNALEDPGRSLLWFNESRLRYWRKWKGPGSFHLLRACLLLKLLVERRAARGPRAEALGEIRRLLCEARYRP